MKKFENVTKLKLPNCLILQLLHFQIAQFSNCLIFKLSQILFDLCFQTGNKLFGLVT